MSSSDWASSPGMATLTTPAFSATKTRPSGALAAATGDESPPTTTRSENPDGSVAAAAWVGTISAAKSDTTSAPSRNEQADAFTLQSCRHP